MAVVMTMTWNGLVPEQYEQASAKVGWEERTPEGGLLHVAWFADGALHVLDVWESEGAFHRFAETRLMPVVKGELGFAGEPQVAFHPMHRLYQPGIGARS